MPHDSRAYLKDIIDCCFAITEMLQSFDLEGYRQSRIIRRAVEREFTIIGEAVLALSHRDPEVFDSITHAWRIVLTSATCHAGVIGYPESARRAAHALHRSTRP